MYGNEEFKYRVIRWLLFVEEKRSRKVDILFVSVIAT